MDTIPSPDGFEPAEWWVVFHPTASSRWLSWIAMGHFKHVSAFAYIPGFKAWLLYDVARAGTRLMLLPADDNGKAELVRYTRGCEIVKMTRRPGASIWRFGFFCTTSICHLLGLKCVAAPDSLWRLCLRNGGQPIGRQRSTDADTPCRSEPCD